MTANLLIKMYAPSHVHKSGEVRFGLPLTPINLGGHFYSPTPNSRPRARWDFFNTWHVHSGLECRVLIYCLNNNRPPGETIDAKFVQIFDNALCLPFVIIHRQYVLDEYKLIVHICDYL